MSGNSKTAATRSGPAFTKTTHRAGHDDSSARLRPRKQRAYAVWAICGVLLLAVAFVFGQSARFGFVNFDDGLYIYDNAAVTAGLTLDGIARAFTTAGPGGEWYPLTMLSHMLDVELFGLSPGPHHAINVLLHAVSALILFLAMLRMTDRLWPSALVAALFAVHPLRAESVAWLAERRDVLSGAFFMLTLWLYASYARRQSWLRYLAVCASFAMGLMAKPMIVTLPLVLLLLDYWPLVRLGTTPATGGATARRTIDWRVAGRLALEKVPLFSLAAAAALITLLTHPSGNPEVDPVAQLSIWWRAANGVVSYVTYLGQLVYPVALVPHYPHPGTSLPLWKVAASCLLLLVITASVIQWRRRNPYLLVGWLWFVVTLLPVIGLVQVGLHGMADRYSYVSHIGLYIAMAWAAAYAVKFSALWRRMLKPVAAVVVAALGIAAWHQTGYWRDSETLWTHAMAATPANAVTDFHYGLAMEEKGKTADARDAWERALRLDPNHVKAMSSLGILLSTQGSTDEAIGHFERAARLAPDDAATRNNFGNALAKMGRTDEAIAQFSEAVRLDPGMAMAHFNLAENLSRAGRVDEAAVEYERTIAIDPRIAPAHFYLGLAIFRQGRTGEAVAHWREAVRLEPGGIMSLAGTAWTLATHPDAARRHGAQALALAGLAVELAGATEPQLLDVLSAAQAEAGQFERAAATAQHAVELASIRGESGLADALRTRLNLYRNYTAYRQRVPGF
jgi:Tfp pilus assembly protein PilF